MKKALISILISIAAILILVSVIMVIKKMSDNSKNQEVTPSIGEADIMSEVPTVEIDITPENESDFVEIKDENSEEPSEVEIEAIYEEISFAGFIYQISQDDVKITNGSAPRIYYGVEDGGTKALYIETLENVISEDECTYLLKYSNPLYIILPDNSKHTYTGGKFDFEQKVKAEEKKEENIAVIAGIKYRIDSNEIRLVDNVNDAPNIYYDTVNGEKYIMIESNGFTISNADGLTLSSFIGNRIYLITDEDILIFNGEKFVAQNGDD